MIATFVYFALPKILGSPISVKGFNQFSPLLGLNPDGFRIFTGVTELALALVLSGALLLARPRMLLTVVGYLMTLATMAAGLYIEFFVRVQPAMMLVVIAFVLIIIALFQLKISLPKFLNCFTAGKAGE